MLNASNKILRNTLLASILILSAKTAQAIVISPSDDGSIYSSGSVSDSAYLLASGSIQAVTEFSTAQITGAVSEALLSVNPYGLPLWGPVVHVYGYESTDGQLTSSDYNAGTFLGDWVLPSLGYGEAAFFDVTSFLSSVTSDFVGFNLRTDSGGTNVFSSLEYNYGSPSQLIVTSVTNIPEPMTALLLLTGMFGLVLTRRKEDRFVHGGAVS